VHIILAFLGFVVTILVLLNKLQENGLDVGWLNPLSWRRRRNYRVNHDLNPAYKLESPMEVVALLMVAVAKVDGDFSKEQKARILHLFQSQFHLTQKQASSLLAASVYLLGHNDDVYANPEKVMERSYDKFEKEQSQSLVSLIEQVAQVEGQSSPAQRDLITKIKATCNQHQDSTW